MVNMVKLNHSCSYKACLFRLPTLEGLCHTLRSFFGEAWAFRLDLQNCYWSIHLPPPLVNTIHVAAGVDHYAIIRVPFGWHQALGLVQHRIARVLDSIDSESTVIVQYLDDLLFVGRHKVTMGAVAHRAAATLEREGYLISPKSQLDPVQNVSWMGKQICLPAPRIAPSIPFVADVVAKWLKLAVRPYNYKNLRRLSGKLVWLGRPRSLAGSFLAGPHAWLNSGPYTSRKVPFAMVRALLEALAYSFRGWERSPAASSPPVRGFADAPPDPRHLCYFVVGLWSKFGTTIRRCCGPR